MLTFNEVNTLGQILDTTWGKSSTVGSPTLSVKGKLQGEELCITFTTYATFASNVAMSQQLPKLLNEGEKVCDQYVKYIRDEFRKSEKRALKLSLISADHSVEVISLQPHISPKRTIIFRFVCRHKIS